MFEASREADMTTVESPRGPVGGRLAKFFFDREVPYGMALMRIVLPCTLLINFFQRWPYVREIYSADGAPGPLGDNFGFPGLLPEFPGSVAVALFTAMGVLFVTSSIGWCTRFSLLASTALYMYFGLMDCMSTITKFTVIATHLLLLLGLSHCGAVWSVDSWLARRGSAGPVDPESLRFPVWPQRLVQLLLGFIYFGAAITKMHTPAFFSGDQLMYWMMTYINNKHPLGDLLAQYPLVLSVFGYITICWETIFLFTVFQPWLKWWVLAVGALFHIMTAFTLGLYVFPLVMLASYIAFLTESEVSTALNWAAHRGWFLRPAFNPGIRIEDSGVAGWRPNLASIGTFTFALLLVCLAGVQIEHWIDPYQMRGPGGPLTPRQLSQDEVDRLFGPELPLRQIDRLLAFDLGTIVVGEHLIDRRREFSQGERFFAQLTLSPPHEDMWVDCVLTEAVDEERAGGIRETVPGKQLLKIGQIVPREAFRSNFVFRLNEDWEPGEYFLKLRSAGEEIARRKFTLAPKLRAPAAN
jgi:hypothetical protein